MKAISPVIATVIIVAVAIAISIAVALWITGLTSTFTGVEKLEIVNAYAVWDSNASQWNVTIIVRNTGTKPATIDEIFINNIPVLDKLNAEFSNGKTIEPGKNTTITFTLSPNKTINGLSFTHGQTISIVIHTASGGQYPAQITLP